MLNIKKTARFHEGEESTDTSLNEVLLQYHPGVQRFRVHTSRKSTLISKNGTRFTFPAYSIRSISGEVIHKEVEICILENTRPSEMIASGRPGTTGGQQICMRWQLEISAFFEGIALSLHNSVSVELPLEKPLRSPQKFAVYRGGKSSIITYPEGPLFEWDKNDQLPLFHDKKEGYYYLSFSVPTFDWYAVGTMNKKKHRDNLLTVKLQEDIEKYDELAAFLVYPSMNSTAYLYKSIRDFKGLGCPQNEEVVAVVIGKKKGKIFLGIGYRKNATEKLLRLKLSLIQPEALLDRINERCPPFSKHSNTFYTS